MSSEEQQPIFRDLSGEDPDPEVTEVESMCMYCHKNGMTRLLLTRIPHYKNVVIMSFSCEECGYENNEIQDGGALNERGVRWELQVRTPEDMNRQVVKSDYSSVSIPEIDFEIPSQSQKGEVTTVEGIVSRAAAGLLQEQPERRRQHPQEAAQIDAFLLRLQALRALHTPWTLRIEDISGNSYIENPFLPSRDPACVRTDFKRTKEQDHLIGIFTHDEVQESPSHTASLLTPVDISEGNFDKMAADEVLQFRTNCPECNAPADTNMKITDVPHCVLDVPHFKQVVIMATTCDACGHRTNEVKSGGGVEDKGVRFEVKIASRDDFSRDILKSETCSMEIPELDLSVGGRALGGRFSTAEGLVRATRDQLANCPGLSGDAPHSNKDSMQSVLAKLDEVIEQKRAITLVLDDPAGNSYVQSLADEPGDTDEGLKITRYERTFDQNEELGLNDMKTENYS